MKFINVLTRAFVLIVVWFLLISVIYPKIWQGGYKPLLEPETQQESFDEYMSRFPPNEDPNFEPMPFPE